ncbi:MAG: hypothetical protein LBF84_03300 [Holosporales bacterium]|nr:hypothetical protein [Holosporales bacterium]
MYNKKDYIKAARRVFLCAMACSIFCPNGICSNRYAAAVEQAQQAVDDAQREFEEEMWQGLAMRPQNDKERKSQALNNKRKDAAFRKLRKAQHDLEVAKQRLNSPKNIGGFPTQGFKSLPRNWPPISEDNYDPDYDPRWEENAIQAVTDFDAPFDSWNFDSCNW